jgi:DNA-binding transcriptional LysR family regulator
MDETPGEALPFRLAYAPGVTPSKWVRVWRERRPLMPLELILASSAEAALLVHAGKADAGLLRLPVDSDLLRAIPLYEETSVVVVPLEHPIAAYDSVTTADLADEVVLNPLDDVLDWGVLPGERSAMARPATTSEAIALVAADVGVLVVPQSVARLHHRKDLTYRPVSDAPQSQVGLCWPVDRTSDDVEELIGIVRGRTVNSSRGRAETTSDKAGSAKAGSDKARAGMPHDDQADHRAALKRKAEAKGPAHPKRPGQASRPRRPRPR